MRVFNIGATENDKTGDKLRVFADGCNFNFNEISTTKADLVSGKVPLSQLPTKTVSTSSPTGIPANGDEWVIYSNL
jgi:hypothetical protein